MVPQRPLAITLPRQLRFTRLVLQCCGAGFTADGHQSSSRGLIATRQYASVMPVSHATTIARAIKMAPTRLMFHPICTDHHHLDTARGRPIGRCLHSAANLQKAAAG
jgi:hypothetical protein